MSTSPEQQPIKLDDLIEHVVEQHPGADDLELLSEAVETSSHLGEVADHLIGHFVDRARQAGASWTDIGQHMGVTKQAVQKRFVAKESDELDHPNRGRWKRFTPRARSVITHTTDEARRLGSRQVGSEHILLGLLDEPDGLAAYCLIGLGVPLERVRQATLDVLPPASEPTTGRVGFGRDAKKTMELSVREALRMGHNYIGTEHILLGLMRAESDPAAQLLAGLGVTLPRADEWVRATLEAHRASLRDVTG
ncbi:ClpA/ClpB-like protein [Jatrophihabitans sp. GAS493]|uniref:Clp protease N-terminal domain-containing protein n=1 Tax=Jatrophihabitans sp. GAS493 TaxID=1907575 RepID=UPI000BB93FA9|nr:Clp protease N-terminal domain-containing protein [Jatrophihabitans sp. GAS493]SOD71111.1 ClpA/ClpB-like protein [Jatrophihabitans sp. GAS493]